MAEPVAHLSARAELGCEAEEVLVTREIAQDATTHRNRESGSAANS
jgi:hypothetical protein